MVPSRPPPSSQRPNSCMNRTAGTAGVGHRAASVYSLVLSCYRLGMDPWAYFRDVLPKLGDTRFPASRLAELLPESWAQQQTQQR